MNNWSGYSNSFVVYVCTAKELIAQHHETLSSSLKNDDLNVFEKYADCFTEYASLIEVQAFEIGFKLAVKLLIDRE